MTYKSAVFRGPGTKSRLGTKCRLQAETKVRSVITFDFISSPIVTQ